jgi:hypothetical protein
MAAAGLLLGLCLAAPPTHAGDYLDLGLRAPLTTYCIGDSTTYETFPADAFGVFPPRSWVWQEIVEAPCESLRWPDQVCWNGAAVRSFQIVFNDGGCGCGGFLEKASTLRLSYDPAVVAARGIAESDLRLAYNDPATRGWRPVEGALPDTEANAFVLAWSGEILGAREFAIVTPVFVSVEPTTWSRVKSLLSSGARR